MTYQFDLKELILSLSNVLDLANPSLMQHQQKTTYIAIRMAETAGMDYHDIERLFLASILHDIGAFTVSEKVDIHASKNIDTRPHCEVGYRLYDSVSWLKPSASIVLYHHAEWSRLSNDMTSIHNVDLLCSQILHLADKVEAMIRKDQFILVQKKRVRDVIKHWSNDDIHPMVIELFLEISAVDAFWLELDAKNLQNILRTMFTREHIRLNLEEMADVARLFKKIVDFRSHSTATHSTGVSACASILSALFDFSSDEVKLMEIAGDLHDIGKLAVPEEILEKPGRLTEDEFEIIKQHVYYTYKILGQVKGFEKFTEWAAHHHERLNGKGYPFSLSRNHISIGARIFAVSDVYAALTEDRPYRKKLDDQEVHDILSIMAENGHLDDKVVKVLFDNEPILRTQLEKKKKEALEEYAHYMN